jgi:hypothetical protein
MRAGSLASLLLLVISGPAGSHYPLPAKAVIAIGPRYIDPDVHPEDRSFCEQYTLTKAQVRRQFRTYRELHGSDLHDLYIWTSCGYSGTVTVQGKTYTWKTQIGGTMDTTWPDGVNKTLGGKPTDDLSEGESKK